MKKFLCIAVLCSVQTLSYAQKTPFQITTAPRMTPTIDGNPNDWSKVEGFTMSFAHGERSGDPTSEPLEVEIKYAWDDDRLYHMITEISDDDPTEGITDVDWCQECTGSAAGPAPWSTDSIGFYDQGLKWPGISDVALDTDILEVGPFTQYWVGLTTEEDMVIDGVPQYRHLTRGVNDGRSEGATARLIGPESVVNEGSIPLIPDLEDVELTNVQSAFSVLPGPENGGRGRRTVEFFMEWDQIRYSSNDDREGVQDRIEELLPDIEGHLLEDVKEGYEFRLEPLLVDGIDDFSFGGQTHPSGVEHPNVNNTTEWNQISVVRLGAAVPGGIPTNGLVAYYDFEEIEDGFVLDKSGNNLHGMILGDPDDQDAHEDGLDDIRISDLTVDGRPGLGKAVHFHTDAANNDPRAGGNYDMIALCDQENYVEGCDLAADGDLIPKDGFTVSAWLRVEETGQDHSLFQSWATGRGFIHTQVQGDGRLRFRLRGDANSDNIVANNVFLNGEGSTADPENDAVPREEWFHWVGTYQASEVEDEPGEFAMYFNGEEYASGEADGNAAADPLLKQLGDWGQDAYIGLVPDLGRQLDGHIDEFRLYNRGVTPEEALALYTYNGPDGPGGDACDINGDGVCDAADIDAMTQMVIDGDKTQADRTALIESPSPDGLNTYIGDSDLNGQFDEQDFVAAFIGGKYITGEQATWAQGDWDGNFVFDEQDFVAAFVAGGYLQGPRASVAAVPEPSSLVLLALGMLAFVRRRR